MLPVTIRLANGAGAGFGAQHSQSVENWFLNVPGLRLVAPATPADAYALLRAAIRDPNPVLFFEHKSLFNRSGELDEDHAVVLGRAEIVRPGTHVTVVATQLMRHRAVEAAETLEADGISAEVIDARTLVPFDRDTVTSSVDRTNRLVVVQESAPAGSWGATLVADLMHDRFESFDAPPALVSADETPTPYAGPLEEAWIPSAARIADTIRATVAF
jgi:pyruvate dehydrogenase E1 component beta subunit